MLILVSNSDWLMAAAPRLPLLPRDCCRCCWRRARRGLESASSSSSISSNSASWFSFSSSGTSDMPWDWMVFVATSPSCSHPVSMGSQGVRFGTSIRIKGMGSNRQSDFVMMASGNMSKFLSTPNASQSVTPANSLMVLPKLESDISIAKRVASKLSGQTLAASTKRGMEKNRDITTVKASSPMMKSASGMPRARFHRITST
mmetsp:Transcript_122482/g.305881  ORF Transcript_122482/g.305881 Transcript_122482/m.305881 type:complete len:202 (-) Transcript_122482:1375-1980(-)